MEEDSKKAVRKTLDVEKYFSEDAINQLHELVKQQSGDAEPSRDHEEEDRPPKEFNLANSATTDTNEFYSYFGNLTIQKKPIIYSPDYNISFMGLEKLHPFDSCKYSKVINFLLEAKVLKPHQIIKPKNRPTKAQLLLVHTEAYINSLNNPSVVASVTELPFLAALPHFLLQKQVLNPFLSATSGSILAGHVAMQRGWAINVGGGFHHCCSKEGGGFCAYADITLTYHYVRKYYPLVSKVMIIDLDAHQGNGHENDKIIFDDDNVYILDMFNPSIYPGDYPARKAINLAIHADSGIETDRW